MTESNPLFKVKATRFGWKDFVLNLFFSLIMIGAFIVTIFFANLASVGDWFIALLTIIVPLALFLNRTQKELLYSKDFISISHNKELVFHSTPMLVTGLRVRKGTIPLIDIRRFGLARIPHKFSLDLWKYKNKAMLLIYSRTGKEIFLGEYIRDEHLAELCKTIEQLYPKAKLVGDKSYLNLTDSKTTISDKQITTDKNDEEPEGVFFRQR